MGFLMGSIEVLFLNQLFVKERFWKKILFKAALYLFSTISLSLIIIYVATSIRLNLPLTSGEVAQTMQAYAFNPAFLSILIYAGVVTILSLFILEVLDYLGSSMFIKFFTGKYYRPVEEERIFMFLDMKDSTTIAEKLGNFEFFKLLRRYYSDTTDAIVKSNGEVYQYGGDEIIVSWNLINGLSDNQCIHCFFLIKDAFKKHSNNYIERFGFVPKFKAGFHCGKVITGEIGELKKDIFFTGDVLNTCSRIQDKCNIYKTDILLSGELFSRLKLDDSFESMALGESELKGRKTPVELYTLRKDH